jgi:uncharacterized membrane protein YgdD (TMEM256/DUF423 family)
MTNKTAARIAAGTGFLAVALGAFGKTERRRFGKKPPFTISSTR